MSLPRLETQSSTVREQQLVCHAAGIQKVEDNSGNKSMLEKPSILIEAMLYRWQGLENELREWTVFE